MVQQAGKQFIKAGNMKKIFIFLLLASSAFGQTAVNINYAGRTGGTVIPQNMIGTNIAGLSGTTPLGNLVSPASITHTRLFVSLAQDCTGTTGTAADCTWTLPLGQLALLAGAGLQVTLEMTGDPAFLQQTVGSCPSGTLTTCICQPPTNNTTWQIYTIAGIAAMLTAYPHNVDSVELWNEPDSTVTWCPVSGTALSTFENFIGTVGANIKASTTIPVGTLAITVVSDISTWVPGVLSVWSTPSFLSYHIYLSSSWASWASLLAGMQATSGGYGNVYNQFQTALTSAGYAGPAWITEVNDGYAFVADCCRIDNTYSLMYNTLMIMDHLNAINTSSATTIPQRIYQYAEQSIYFCFFGNLADGDCTNAVPIGIYPNYYAYQLLTQLSLTAGGNMATSISPASTLSGLSCSAWYTFSGDSLVCVNPTASPITLAYTLSNTGLTTAMGISYLLNSTNPTVSTSSLALTNTGGSNYTASATIPAYSSLGAQIYGAATNVNNGFKSINGSTVH
jgi:hypothetical protein